MNNTTTELSENHVRMTISVSKEEFLAERKKALKKIQSTANIPGFRPGKAPESVVLKMYGQGLGFDETYRKAFQVFEQELKEKNLHLLLDPLVEVAEGADFNSGENLAFHFEYAIEPAIKLTEDDLANEVLYEVYLTDEEFQQELEAIKARNKKAVSVEDFEKAEAFRITIHTHGLEEHEQPTNHQDQHFELLKSDIRPEKLEEFRNAFEQKNTDLTIAEFLINPDDKKNEALLRAQHFYFDSMIRFEEPSLDELKELIFGRARKFESDEVFLSAVKELIEKYLNEDAMRVFIQNLKTKAEAKINGIPKGFLEKWWNREERNKEINFETTYPQLEYKIKSNITNKALNALLDVKVTREQVKDHYVNQHLGYIEEEKREALRELIGQMVENNLNDRRQSQEMYDKVYEEVLFEKIKARKTNPFRVTFSQFNKILSNK